MDSGGPRKVDFRAGMGTRKQDFFPCGWVGTLNELRLVGGWMGGYSLDGVGNGDRNGQWIWIGMYMRHEMVMRKISDGRR